MIITYNHEKFIARALESVLAQRANFDFEIVIGEDHSTDRTREILMDFHHRYPGRIVPLLRKRNLGAMRNLSKTLAACRGDYVALLEADDYWTSDQKLQKQVDFLDTHPDIALCCHRVRFQYEMHADVLEQMGIKRVDVFPSHAAGSYTIQDLLNGNFIMTCSTVFRRSLVGTLPRWFSKMKLGDWPLFVLVARYGNIELMDDIMAHYRVHSGGIWSSLSRQNRMEAGIRVLRALTKEVGPQDINVILDIIARPHLEKAMAAQVNGDRAETARQLYACMHNGGWQFRGSRRTMLALAAFALMGPWYKIFSRKWYQGT